MRTLVAVGALIAVVTGSAAFARKPSALEPLAFLVGEWPASGTGQPASGTAVFTRGLQDRVILRTTSYAEYPGTGGPSRARHDDLMLEDAGILRGEFAVAPAGTPEAFEPYLGWESRKASAPGR